VVIVWAIVCAAFSSASAQQRMYDLGDMPEDSLMVQHEFWAGLYANALYQMHFGTLATQYVGGTAPGAQNIAAVTEGGHGYGGGGGIVMEYRPLGSMLALNLRAGAEWRYSTTTTDEPLRNGIYAYNAVYEIQVHAVYFSVAPSVRYQISRTGTFIEGGLDVDIPVKGQEAFLWQHELPTDDPVGEEPGFPQVSIGFRTSVPLAMRVGMHVGVGKDFLVGLFGYRSQLVTPYLSLQVSSGAVTDGSTWNGIVARMGVQWRYGLF
jgi:hypothetical protein